MANHKLICRQIQHRQDDSAHQVALPSIEATLGWNNRKQVSMFPPVVQPVCFQRPSPTFLDQCHHRQVIDAALVQVSGRG